MNEIMRNLIKAFTDESSDTLGEIIKELESLPSDLILPVGLSNPHSYRGYYDHLAFEPVENVTVEKCLRIAKGCVGKTFIGYKGGEFKMSVYTSCWLSVHGQSGGIQLSVFLIRLLIIAANRDKK